VKSSCPIGCPDPGHLFIQAILVQKMGAGEKDRKAWQRFAECFGLVLPGLAGLFPLPPYFLP